MIKALVLDADGVIFKPRDKFFSEIYSEKHNISLENILSFFKQEYKEITIGKKDFKKSLTPYLDKWQWQGTVDELLEYWFSHENNLEERIIDLIKQIQNKELVTAIASDHSKYRADDMWKNIGLKEYFDYNFNSAYLGYTKEQPEFFEKVISQLKVNPEEIMFWDDDQKNVEVARTVGIQSFPYQSFGKFEKQVTEAM